MVCGCDAVQKADIVHDPLSPSLLQWSALTAHALQVLCDEHLGVLKAQEFSKLNWMLAPRAAIADVLRCHQYSYLEKLKEVCPGQHATARVS